DHLLADELRGFLQLARGIALVVRQRLTAERVEGLLELPDAIAQVVLLLRELLHAAIARLTSRRLRQRVHGIGNLALLPCDLLGLLLRVLRGLARARRLILLHQLRR